MAFSLIMELARKTCSLISREFLEFSFEHGIHLKHGKEKSLIE